MISKSLRFLVLIVVVAILCFYSSQKASAQTGGLYDLTWNTLMDGGGGTSTGGPYELTGTIAQSDASNVKTGGPYEHTGGFWFGTLLLGEPYIYVYKDGNDARIEWAQPGSYDVYADTAPGDPLTFPILDANRASPYWHTDALILPDDYYYNVRP